MPITPYVRPQETITQILRATPAPSVNRRNPLVIGPEYLLANYDPDNRYQQAYVAAGAGTVDYAFFDADGNSASIDTVTHTIDEDSVILFATDLEVRVSEDALVGGKLGTNLNEIEQASVAVFFTGAVGVLEGKLNDRPMQIGDIVYVTNVTVPSGPHRRTVIGFVDGANPGEAAKVILNGTIPGAATNVVTFSVETKFTGKLSADVLTSVSFALIDPDATDVNYGAFTFEKAAVGVPATGTVAPVSTAGTGSQGKLAVYFRAVRKVGETDGVITINSLNDITQLGPIELDNWLAYGAYQAFKGNQSSKIYVLRTGGDSVEHFTEALAKIRSTDYYYALAPMTDLDEVKELVAVHCDEMSNKYNRNFRRCYVGTDTPAGFVVWGNRGIGGVPLEGTVVGQQLELESGDQALGDFLTDLSVGDTLHLGATYNAGTGVISGGDEVEISQIVSSSIVQFTGTTSETTNAKIIGVRKDSAANVVKYFQERSIGSRRAVNVWCDKPVEFGTAGSLQIPMKFVAAEIAGLRCALLPQQGLTMTEILSIDAAPGMYTRFTPEQIDVIASNGVMVVTQEIEGGEIFIRHQLTTKTDAGALAYEDNIGVIVDEFSYRVKDAFRQYLGRRNVTRETMAEIAAKLKDLAIAATQESLANREIGPMVIRFFSEDDKEGEVTVRVDGNLADHIITYVRLRVPLPINGIDHYIDVETSVEL